MEQDCVMQVESAPPFSSKMAAAATPAFDDDDDNQLHHIDDGDDDDDDDDEVGGLRRRLLLSTTTTTTTTATTTKPAAAGKSADNSNNQPEQLQKHSSSSSSSSSSEILKSKLINISCQNSLRTPKKSTDVLGHNNHDGKRFQHRRRRRTNSFKRSYTSTVSWQERREDFRRRKAAIQRQSVGLSVAPYNTTQFLMEEHQGEVDEEELLHPRRKRGDSFNSVESFGEDYNSSSFEDDEYLHAQFCAEYDSVASERLHAMSKAELVHEYLLLEARIDSLEEELKVVKKAEETDQPMEIQATEEDIAKITVFQQEISKLLEENRRLQVENDNLQQNVAPAVAAEEEESISVDDQ